MAVMMSDVAMLTATLVNGGDEACCGDGAADDCDEVGSYGDGDCDADC